MAKRELHRLAAKGIEKKTPGRYADGGGLYLQVQEASGRKGVTRSWLFRYTLAGKAREMGLGPAHTVPLASSKVRADGRDLEIRGARDLAADARRLLLDGVDPLEARKAAKEGSRLAAEGAKTFKQCAEAYIKTHRASWRNTKHGQQWENTLETYAYDKIGGLAVAAIDTPQILKVLEPIWSEKSETASRLRGRIESILDWATVRGYRKGLNPARWRGHLDQTLPKRSRLARIEHHAALPFDDVSGFFKMLREQEGVAAKALEFLILTAARTGEVIGATWDEIDLRNRVWTIPAERMKGRRLHKVPLVDRAVAILEEVKALRVGDHVFPGRGRGKPLSNMAMLKTLERMKRDDITAHGFRSTFRDWASERTSFPREAIEMSLAHAIGDKVEAAYRRGDLFEKRRKLMETWAQFCEKPPASVTPIHAGKEKSR